jgi:hypothetical protein
VRAFFGGYGSFSAFFFITFFNSPCYDQKNKNKTEQNNPGRKKNGGKKAIFFVMSPD